MNIQKTKTFLIYHQNCPDGIAASWVYLHYNKLHGSNNEDIQLVPANAGKAPIDLNWKDSKVVVVDLSFKQSDIIQISSQAKSIIILDHHESARSELSGEFPLNVWIVFDIGRCGAQLAWDYWFPDDPRPWFIEIIADRDLWKWKIPLSKQIGAYLHQCGVYESHDKFDTLLEWNDEEINIAKQCGQVITNMEEKQIQAYVKSAKLTEFKTPNRTYKVYLANCPHQYASDVGAHLYEKSECDFAASWRYSFECDEWSISCRSNKSRTDIDLSKICKEFGGGGHAQAAGFTIKTKLQDYFLIL